MAIRQQLKDEEETVEKVGTRYTVRNPHPGFGTDPNIINEFGHTVYPKWIDHPTEKEKVNVTTHITKDHSEHKIVENKHPRRVLVQNEKEERELMELAKRSSEPSDEEDDNEAKIEESKKKKPKAAPWNN